MMAARTQSLMFFLCFGLSLPSAKAQESPQLGLAPPTQGASAGNPAPPPTLDPKDRLKRLEHTFASNLAQIHRPLLLEHLHALTSLNKELESKGSMAELALIRLEISETQAKLQANSGIPFEYKDPKLSSLSTSQALSLPVVAKMVLNADQAEGAALGSPTITLGKTQWLVHDLPAGNYQLNLVYQALSTASPMQVRWTALGQTGTAPLGANSENPNANAALGVELGVLKVPGSAPSPFPFILESLSMFGPPLHVRHLILSVAPEAPK